MSIYPDGMSNSHPDSPSYSEPEPSCEKEHDSDDWDDMMRGGDINREEDYTHEKDIERRY